MLSGVVGADVGVDVGVEIGEVACGIAIGCVVVVVFVLWLLFEVAAWPSSLLLLGVAGVVVVGATAPSFSSSIMFTLNQLPPTFTAGPSFDDASFAAR